VGLKKLAMLLLIILIGCAKPTLSVKIPIPNRYLQSEFVEPVPCGLECTDKDIIEAMKIMQNNFDTCNEIRESLIKLIEDTY